MVQISGRKGYEQWQIEKLKLKTLLSFVKVTRERNLIYIYCSKNTVAIDGDRL